MKIAPYAQALPGAFEREEEEIESSQALHYRQKLTSQNGSRSHLWKSFDNEARHYARVEIRSIICLFVWRPALGRWEQQASLSASVFSDAPTSHRKLSSKCVHTRDKCLLSGYTTYGGCHGSRHMFAVGSVQSKLTPPNPEN